MDTRLERRLAPRRNTSLRAEVVFANGRSSVACIVRNISDTGAKLELASVAKVPATFDLLVPGHHAQPCRVVWRALKELGVSFETRRTE